MNSLCLCENNQKPIRLRIEPPSRPTSTAMPCMIQAAALLYLLPNTVQPQKRFRKRCSSGAVPFSALVRHCPDSCVGVEIRANFTPLISGKMQRLIPTDLADALSFSSRCACPDDTNGHCFSSIFRPMADILRRIPSRRFFLFLTSESPFHIPFFNETWMRK